MLKFSLVFTLTMIVMYSKAQSCADNASASGGTCSCDYQYYGSNANAGGSCTRCPTGSEVNTQTKVGTVADCDTCYGGYYMTAAAVSTPAAGAKCSPCPGNTSAQAGEYTPSTISSCNVCISGYYMQSTQISAAQPYPNCMQCLNGSSTQQPQMSVGDVSNCNVCSSGYYMVSASTSSPSPSAANCSSCPSNSSSSLQMQPGTIASCNCYDKNTIPLSSSQSSCVCKNGYSGPVSTKSDGSNGCTACLQGQFSNSGSACVTCANGSTVSQDQGSCTCNDSSTGVTAWSASTNKCQCSANYYGDPSTAKSGVTGSCTPCPTGKTSPVGTTSLNGCIAASSSSPGNSNSSSSPGNPNSSTTEHGSITQASILVFSAIFLVGGGLLI